jgi:hypothetical protein
MMEFANGLFSYAGFCVGWKSKVRKSVSFANVAV